MDRKYFHSGSSLLFHHFNGIFQWTKVFKLSDCWQCLGSLESRLWESLLFKLFIYCPLDQHSWEGGDNKRCLLIINAWGALECILPLRVVRCWDKMTELVYICLNELGFPGGSDGKQSACNVGDPGLISGSGISLGEGNGYPLQYSCLAWRMPKIEEPGRLKSMGSQRVQHNSATKTFTFFTGSVIDCSWPWKSMTMDRVALCTRGCPWSRWQLSTVHWQPSQYLGQQILPWRAIWESHLYVYFNI